MPIDLIRESIARGEAFSRETFGDGVAGNGTEKPQETNVPSEAGQQESADLEVSRQPMSTDQDPETHAGNSIITAKGWWN